ncbi:MAG: serine/threonine-protein kinase [Lacipirellulaceae bacterium]
MTHEGAHAEASQAPTLGPYVLGKQLGRGGMGLVYEATHRETGQRVAIKSLSPQLATSDGFRERFDAEIASLETLRHEGIVRLYGYGEEGGTLYYAMELVEGPSLEEELRRGRRYSWRETTQIAVQVSRALKHAHDHGIVHRDIKPANILIGPRGQAKLADFGIARLFGATGVTIAGGVLGTADYMSPEQAAGKPVTARCDQYSLGGVIYALLAGRPPFRAESLPAMLQLQLYAVAEPLRRYAPDIPAELERIVAQLLDKDPAARFPNTLVLARRLEAMLHALARPTMEDDFVVGEFRGRPAIDPDAIDSRLLDADPAETREAPPILGESISLPGLSQASTPAAPADPATPQNAPRTVRYTAVAPEADESIGGWRSALGPAVILVAAIVALSAGAWWWTRPLDANALHARLAERNERGDTDSGTRAAFAEFFERFPNDPRIDEVRQWSDEVATRSLEKQLALGRLAGRVQGRGASAEDLLHARAVELGRQSPELGAKAFGELATLLAAPAASTGSKGTARARNLYADLARREAQRLAAAHAAQEKRLVAFCQERLAALRGLAATNPQAAARGAAALERLVPRTAATAALLDEAIQLAAAKRSATE